MSESSSVFVVVAPGARPAARRRRVPLFPHAVHEGPELARARRMTQLAQCLGFDLAYALAGDGERLAYFFQRVLRTVFQPEAHLDDLLFARRERAQHLRGLLFQVDVDDRFGRRDDRAILDEVAEVRIFLFADWRLQRNWLLRDLQHLADLRHRDVHPLGDLFRRRFAAHLLHQLARGADQLVDGLDHVDRNANRARLVGDRARDRLPDPPRGVGRELVAAAVFELVHRLHQADVALLDEVEELQPAVGVLLGNRNHQAEVGLDELALGLLRVHLALDDVALGAAQLLEIDPRLRLHLLDVGADLADLLLEFLLLLLIARQVGAAVAVLHLVLEAADGVDGLGDAVDQPLALGVGVADGADGARDRDHFASQVPAAAAEFLRLLGAGNVAQLLGQRHRLLVVLGEGVDLAGHFLEPVLQDLFGDLLFVTERDHFLDGAHAAAQIVAGGQNLADDDGRSEERRGGK